MFFQLDSLLLDFARYVFSYYAVLQLKNIQNIVKNFYSEQSNDVAAKQINSLNFLEPNEEQIKSIISELDDRIEDHRKEVDTRKDPNPTTIGVNTAAVLNQDMPPVPIQQAAGNVDSNPIKTLTDKFTEKQSKFIDQRKKFKSFVNMLLKLLSDSLDQVIKVHENFLDGAQLDDELKTNIMSIITKIEDGVYHLKPEQSIDNDLDQIDSDLVAQLGKRGAVRYKSILNDINKAVDDISTQNGIVSTIS